jgi:hypothetical protein
MKSDISRRESGAILKSFGAGVVPRIGLQHVAVGRQKEVRAFLDDFATIEDGGAAFRIVCGPYGSGKSFLLQMIRNNAMERGFVVVDADLSPERRLTGSNGQGLATYRELIKNMAIRTRPDNGALESVLQKWVNGLQNTVAKEYDLKPRDPKLIDEVSKKISEVTMRLSEMVYGFSFGSVIESYWRGIKTGDDNLKQASLRWLRGEFATKTEAKRYLPIDRIIDDENWYEFLKLFALFVCEAGYNGLLVFLDEGVSLYKIPNKQSREKNYEKLLAIFNDTMQGKVQHLGVFLSGTPQFIYDERRGLFSYEALRSRLSDSRFGNSDFANYTGPVIRLDKLSPEEVYLLLERLSHIHSIHYSYPQVLGQAELTAFLDTVASRLGADKLLTPREISRDFLGLLNILYQNPQVRFYDLIEAPDFQIQSAKKDPEEITKDSDELFAKFEI